MHITLQYTVYLTANEIKENKKYKARWEEIYVKLKLLYFDDTPKIKFAQNSYLSFKVQKK